MVTGDLHCLRNRVYWEGHISTGSNGVIYHLVFVQSNLVSPTVTVAKKNV